MSYKFKITKPFTITPIQCNNTPLMKIIEKTRTQNEK